MKQVIFILFVIILANCNPDLEKWDYGMKEQDNHKIKWAFVKGKHIAGENNSRISPILAFNRYEGEQPKLYFYNIGKVYADSRVSESFMPSDSDIAELLNIPVENLPDLSSINMYRLDIYFHFDKSLTDYLFPQILFKDKIETNYPDSILSINNYNAIDCIYRLKTIPKFS